LLTIRAVSLPGFTQPSLPPHTYEAAGSHAYPERLIVQFLLNYTDSNNKTTMDFHNALGSGAMDSEIEGSLPFGMFDLQSISGLFPISPMLGQQSDRGFSSLMFAFSDSD
jgi:hypothetical protein